MLWVGATVGLCILGDSLLYSILPLEAQNLGIPLPLVGILLSANRLVRLISNTWASAVFERMGPRGPFLGAVVLGVFSTALYGIAWGFFVFLLARILWGIAWSGLRQGGYQAVWTGASSVKGRLTGLLWGLVRLGSAVSVLAGGILYDRYGYDVTIGVVIAVTLLAIPVALPLRWPPPAQLAGVADDKSRLSQPVAKRRLWQSWATVLDTPDRRWLAVAGFMAYLLSGIVVSTTSLFLAQKVGDGSMMALGLGVATVTGLLHGTRWITDLALGPLIGLVSDRMGQPTTAALLVLAQVAALTGAILLDVPAAIGCLLAVLVCDGGLHIVLSAAASGAATGTPRPYLFVGAFTTMTDAGSAMGPLVAYIVATVVALPAIYWAASIAAAGAIWRYWWLARRSAV